MNKLFTKIASLTLGLALAAGAGAFLGSRAAESVKADETVDYTTIGTGTAGSEVVADVSVDKITWILGGGITITQHKGSSSNAVNTSYMAANTARIYVGHVISIEADSGFSVVGVKITNSGNKSYYGGNFYASTSWAGGATSISADDTENLTLTNCTSTTANVVSSIVAGGSSSKTSVGAIYISTTKQARPAAITVSYTKPDASDPTGISCADQTIDVTKTVNLANQTTISPAGAVTDLSYSIKSGSDCIDLDTTTGIVTGKKGGSAVVTITPSNTAGGATAIDVNVSVNSITVPDIIVGDQYALYASHTSGNYEMTGIASSLGTATSFSGDIPSCSYLLTVEEGYYENTIALKNGTSYLALKSANNNLHTESSIKNTSSWIVTYDNSTNEAVLENAFIRGRTLQLNYNDGSPRYACYASAQTAIKLYHFEDHSLVDFTIESEVSVYKTGTATISVTYDPADASDKTLSWSSDDTSIATVDSNGVVTGVAVGTTTITATKVIDEFNVERTCTVTVLNNVSAHRGTVDDPFNVADAVQVANGIFVEDPDGTAIDLTKEYYVYGMITKTVNRTTSTLTFWIGDDASQTSAAAGGFEVYKAAKVYGEALATRYSTDSEVAADFQEEDYIKVKSTLTIYKGTAETTGDTADIVYSSRIEAGSYSAEVVAFAEDLLGYTCDASGETAPSVEAWGSFATFYAGDTLSADDKAALVGAPAVEHETPVTNDEKVEAAMAKYDYVVGKYNKTLGLEEQYPDFINRNPAALKNISAPTIGTSSTNTAIIVVSVIAIVSVSSIGVLLVLKRRKNHI